MDFVRIAVQALRIASGCFSRSRSGLAASILVVTLLSLFPRGASASGTQADAYNYCIQAYSYTVAVQRFGSANCVVRSDISPPAYSSYQYWVTFPGGRYFCTDIASCSFIGTPRPTASPGKANGAPKQPCNCVADPINAGSGNVYHRQQDFAAGKWLNFERYYNSDASAGIDTLGRHWRHTYSRHIAYTPPTSSTMAAATVTREDGQVATYQLQASIWVGEQDVHDTLTEQADSSGNPTAWALVRVDTQSTEQFNAAGYLTSINARDGSTVVLTYSDASTPASTAPGAGYLLTVTDSSQRSIHFIYDASGRISQIAAPDGQVYNYAYDTASNLVAVLYPDGKTSGYLYDEAARNGGSTIVGLLTGILDESGGRFISYSYNAAGKAIENEQAGGTSSYALTYNSDGSVDVVDPYGKVSHRSFMTVDGTPLISGVNGLCASCSTIASWAYDFNNEPVQATDFNGHVVTYKHDSAGLETVRVEASGDGVQRSIQTDWNDVLHVPTERRWLDSTSALIKKTDWIYNTRGQTLAQCDIDPAQAANYACSITGTVPAGVRRWTTTYCTTVGSNCPLVGLMLTATGPRTDLIQTTTYSYYTSSSATGCGTPGAACYQPGDLYQVTDALGHVTTIASYDGAGRVTRITDANGVNTDLTYTPRGWLASRTVGGATTNFTYTPYGAVATVTDPDNVTTTYTYDAAHRLTRITDALGNYVQYTLDAAGNVTQQQTFDSSGTVHAALSRTYNTLGQLTAVVDGLNHTVFNAGASGSYDANGNLVLSTDALGFQRKLGYDALNRLISILDNYNGTDTATKNTQTVFDHDALDRLNGVADPSGLDTVYTYDGLGNHTQLASPDTGTSTDTYDAAGNRLTHTDAKGMVSTSTYDALNRRIGTGYTDTTLNVSYAYDEANAVTGCTAPSPIGRLTRVVEGAVTTVFCYDGRGNVIQKRQLTSSQTDTTLYAYTAGNRLSSVSTTDQTAISYAYDSDGRVSSVQVTPAGASTAPPTVVSSISYLPFGPISSYTLGNGQTITRTYDANYRLTDLTSPALALHFARDAIGNITAIGNAPGANPATETYSYDPLYRLTGISDNGTALESYTYGPTGDRLSKTAPGLATGAYLYTSGTHQLASINGTSRANDANGNTTGSVIGGNTYGSGYNGRNRMTVAQLNGSTVGTYTYNVMGQRIGKVATFPQAVTERYAYDEASQLIGEYGSTNRDYIWLDGFPVAVIDNTINGSITTSVVNYVHADGLGTPRAVTDGTGTVIWSWAYQGNPWGEQQPTSATGYVLNLRYPGQYYDVETGLAHNGFRDYCPACGRYIQSDPIGLAGGISTYAYVGNNPLSNVDPLGLQELLFRIGRIGGLLSEEPLVPRPLIEPVKPLPPGAPTPQLPEDFPKIPTDPTQCPGKGWEWRGAPGSKPGDPNGGWYNPEKHWTLHPDMDHPEPIPPHWDWVDENKVKYRIFPQAPPIDPLHPPIT